MTWFFLVFATGLPLLWFGLLPIVARIDGDHVEWNRLVGGALFVAAGIYMTAICADNAFTRGNYRPAPIEDREAR